ncbi:hypothetical protein [Dactylosporangium sp. NPDC000521]|uniref:hypothetical protein n=1 Tax=Dactylosporangium sp. NPDC000521 TaxID=3363975 RepID=UPI0036860678
MPPVSPGLSGVAWGPPPARGLPARVTVLSGPSGVGKTRLADAYAGQCIADGWPLVLRLSATGESLALDWLETGRVDEGIQLLSQVLADQLASAAPVPECIANIEHNLADAYRLAGRDAEAKALYQRCIAGYPRGGVVELTARGGPAALR